MHTLGTHQAQQLSLQGGPRPARVSTTSVKGDGDVARVHTEQGSSRTHIGQQSSLCAGQLSA